MVVCSVFSLLTLLNLKGWAFTCTIFIQFQAFIFQDGHQWSCLVRWKEIRPQKIQQQAYLALCLRAKCASSKNKSWLPAKTDAVLGFPHVWKRTKTKLGERSQRLAGLLPAKVAVPCVTSQRADLWDSVSKYKHGAWIWQSDFEMIQQKKRFVFPGRRSEGHRLPGGGAKVR